MPGPMTAIEGLLIDVDGTLLDGREPIPGAAAALGRARESGLRIRLTTNTTRRSRSSVAAALAEVGIRVERDEVLLPASLARRRILDSGRTRAALLVPDGCSDDFEGISRDEESPDWVVVGDLAEGFTYATLNRAFRCLKRGAALLALQRNRWWHDGERRYLLDAGPFVAALEYASEKEAELVGKPARSFFDLALKEIGLPAGRVMVVGDNLENDIGGGGAAGCRTALVRTGKFRGEAPGPGEPRPDILLDSIASLSPE